MNSIDRILASSKEVNLTPSIDESKVSKILNLKKVGAITFLIPIIMFELLVCWLGTEFYQSIGYKLIPSAIIAVTIEFFYMYFSSSRGVKQTLLRITLLGISVTTLTYSAYKKDENVLRKAQASKASISDTKNRLLVINQELSHLQVENENIEKDMAKYREHELVTKGNRILEPRRKALLSKREKLNSERKNLLVRSQNQTHQLLSQSFISNFSILTIQTLVSIIAFTIIQIAICIALPDIIDQLRIDSSNE